MTTHRIFYIIIIFFYSIGFIQAQKTDNSFTPKNVKKLLQAYPLSIQEYDNGYLIIKGIKVKYEEQVEKNHKDLIVSQSIGDMFTYPYRKGIVDNIPKNYDPGRIRSEAFLKSMYGNSANEVQSNLTTIVWCPKLVNQKIRVTKINGVDKQLQKISDELDQYPSLKKYLEKVGTFNWRKISGTSFLSTHSFGIAIDLNVKFSNYWQWDCKCKSENIELNYVNQIPQLIIDIFEKHGFIWGGKWYHYDTMHFEYRPELLL